MHFFQGLEGFGADVCSLPSVSTSFHIQPPSTVMKFHCFLLSTRSPCQSVSALGSSGMTSPVSRTRPMHKVYCHPRLPSKAIIGIVRPYTGYAFVESGAKSAATARFEAAISAKIAAKEGGHIVVVSHLMKINRRRLLVAAGATAIGGGTGYMLWRPQPVQQPEHVKAALAPDPEFPNPLKVPGEDGLHGIADVGGAFTIVGGPVQYELLRGKPATMLGYALEYQGGRR